MYLSLIVTLSCLPTQLAKKLKRFALRYGGHTATVARPGNRTPGHEVAAQRANHYAIALYSLASFEVSSNRLTGSPTRSLFKPLITRKSVHTVTVYSNLICFWTKLHTVNTPIVISVTCANSRNFKKCSNV